MSYTEPPFNVQHPLWRCERIDRTEPHRDVEGRSIAVGDHGITPMRVIHVSDDGEIIARCDSGGGVVSIRAGAFKKTVERPATP